MNTNHINHSNHNKHTKHVFIAIILLIIFPLNINAQSCCNHDGIRGDANLDGAILVDDLTLLVDYLFKGGPPPVCYEEGDANGDGSILVNDLTLLVDYLFKGGPAPEECPPDSIPNVLINLNIGTWFVTDVVEYNTGGGIIEEYQALSTIIGDTIISDSVWMVIEDTTSADHDYAVNRDEGVWYWSDTLTPPEALALKYPATVGESYPYYEATVYVESINASVTVPAGTFSCYYYRVDAPIIGTLAKIWCAPNIGIVKAEEYGLNLIWTYLKTKTELVSFYLAP